LHKKNVIKRKTETRVIFSTNQGMPRINIKPPKSKEQTWTRLSLTSLPERTKLDVSDLENLMFRVVKHYISIL
jgi:hypothetical protein